MCLYFATFFVVVLFSFAVHCERKKNCWYNNKQFCIVGVYIFSSLRGVTGFDAASFLFLSLLDSTVNFNEHSVTDAHSSIT